MLDTSTVILLAQLDAVELPEESLITAVTLAELSVSPLVAKDPQEMARRQDLLQRVEATLDPPPFDREAARVFDYVAAALRLAGRRAQARTCDAMIAATAMANGLPLYTVNPRDFLGIGGLELHAVPHPSSAAPSP